MAEDELNPLTLGETPEEYIENDDGSVDIVDEDASVEDDTEFYDNLAEKLDEGDLANLGVTLSDLIEKDKQAREKRDKQYEEGIRRTGLGDDAPGGASFDGASKVVHPVMAEACVDFASSAIKELFPPSGPVRTEFVGDISKQQKEKGDRKKELMNWQLTKQMPEYYDELEQLLSQMPLGGSQYLKLRFDESLRRPVAEFIPIDEVYVPYAATNFYSASRATHRQLITQDQFEKRVASGFYRDISVFSSNQLPEQTASELATDKIEGLEDTAYNEDGLRAILEVYTWEELDDSLLDEGTTAPYVIHIDEHTEKVLAIYRNWDEADETLEKLDWIVEFKFIPWRGAYAIGLPHLIGGLSAALTGSLRALLDSAHINNAASMLKLKSGRVVGQNTQVEITGVTDIEAPANVDDIRKIAMPMPFNPPSPVLFQLLGFLDQSAKGVVSTSEEKIADAGNQMPVGTAMALIEQGSKVFSAIHARLHRSQAKVLEILARINSKWLDEGEQRLKLGKVIATREDFVGSLDVLPASDPNIFSETQRFAQLQALMQMATQDAQNPAVRWNQVEIRRRILDLMHIQQPDRLLPPEKDPITADVMTENEMLMKGHPLEADMEQDHMLQIKGHMGFLTSPIQLNNPLVPPQVLMALIAHIGQHVQMYQAKVIKEYSESMGGTEQSALNAMQVAQQRLQEDLGPILQAIPQIQQVLQQRMPPPQMPPEVQASIQIAQMDTNRKAQYDQGMLKLKEMELQGKGQADAQKMQFEGQQVQQQFQFDATEAQTRQALDAQRLQLENASQQFEQRLREQAQMFEQQMTAQRQTSEDRIKELAQQVELIKNREDNARTQYVDLAKNKEDNETKLIIAGMQPESETESE